ncbi:hypothetical protein MMC25_006080 [Agyrium rufum]|nr:hypothetical protein [Agyrium rufum]
MSKGNLAENEEMCSITMILQLLKALEYLHEYNIVNRDVKPENILVDAPSNLKLSDFGLVKQESHFGTIFGTPHYLAPEIAKQKKSYGPKVDVWSLGVVVFERAYDFPSRSDEGDRDCCETIIPAVIDLDDDKLAILLKKMLSSEPEQSLSATQGRMEAERLDLEAIERPFSCDGNVTPTPGMTGADRNTEGNTMPTKAFSSSILGRIEKHKHNRWHESKSPEKRSSTIKILQSVATK